jgi:hypothetical protein
MPFVFIQTKQLRVTLELEALFFSLCGGVVGKVVSGTCCELGGEKISFNFIFPHAHSN